MVEKINNVKSFSCFAAIICQEPERKFKMSLKERGGCFAESAGVVIQEADSCDSFS